MECESSIAMKKGRKNPEIENIIDNITRSKTSQEDEKKLLEKKPVLFFINTLLVFYRLSKLREMFQFHKKFSGT